MCAKLTTAGSVSLITKTQEKSSFYKKDLFKFIINTSNRVHFEGLQKRDPYTGFYYFFWSHKTLISHISQEPSTKDNVGDDKVSILG